jgi:hypothetical protein
VGLRAVDVGSVEEEFWIAGNRDFSHCQAVGNGRDRLVLLVRRLTHRQKQNLIKLELFPCCFRHPQVAQMWRVESAAQ